MESHGPDKTGPFDLLIIGGGINGVGIARDAVGRGLKALLVEQDDLASSTSSSSTKLIHGGLRYLETYEFRLVRESLLERERLLAAAPHLVRPLRFVLPHDPLTRPAWLVRLGLFLYDHLAPRKRLSACERLDLTKDPRGGANLDSARARLDQCRRSVGHRNFRFAPRPSDAKACAARQRQPHRRPQAL